MPKWPKGLWATAIVVVVLSIIVIALQVPVLGFLGQVLLALLAFTIGLTVLLFLVRRLLWRVGRRLAFSYFLLGVLPIPLVLISLFVAGYLLSGFYAGHLYRAATEHLHERLALAADIRLNSFSSRQSTPSSLFPEASEGIHFTYYKNGARVAGDERAPGAMPEFLDEDTDGKAQTSTDRNQGRPGFVALEDGTLTMAVLERRDDYAVLAFFDGDIERQLRAESGVWVELLDNDGIGDDTGTTVQIFGQEFYMLPLDRNSGTDERYEFLSEYPSTWDVRVIGFELSGPLRRLSDGETLSSNVSATLTATPGIIFSSLFSRSPEIDTFGWLAFLLPSFLLFDIYALAALMAILMIVSISRAVNRLSHATTLLQAGDFSVRIPVKRTDQLGVLQRDFNRMASNLEHLVSEAARKEVLERDLDIAQEVQKSLLPTEIDGGEGYSFATYFEPSAGLAGDYYDIVELEHGNRHTLAVVIADVAGHGLSAGLRMAMIKAGVLMLIQEHKEPSEIMASLDQLVRSTQQRRDFVTATLSLIDLESGQMSVTNAGHVPCYLLRAGEVHEIFLAGSPLGVLDTSFGYEVYDLEPGDVVVWLSDGIIESIDQNGDMLGFEAVERALAGTSETPDEVRDRLLEAVHRHSGGGLPEDDCTLVVMRYR